MDLVLTNGLVHDGTGAPPQVRTVGIRSGRLVLDATLESALTELAGSAGVIDLEGRVLCPGFVDIHTHSDLTILSDPGGSSKVSQGVTTEVVGNCGLGLAPLLESHSAAAPMSAVRSSVSYLDLDPSLEVTWCDFGSYLRAIDSARPALNVAAFVGHLPLHAATTGLDDRKPNPGQLDRMVDLLDQSLVAGAVGLSTGLVYPPLCFVDDLELDRLAATVARHDRIFAWHVLDYADALRPSVRQAIRIAERTGCRLQISHLAAIGRRNWGAVQAVLEDVETAIASGCDIGIDIYPYLAGNAPLSQLLPAWALDGGSGTFAPRLRRTDVRSRVREFWADRFWDWQDIVISAISGESSIRGSGAGIFGRAVPVIAAELGTDTESLVLDLLSEYGSAISMVAFGRSDDDLRAVLRHPATVVASDGLALDPTGVTGAAGHPHPRSYGCFPRYLRHYADDLSDGIRRCTSAPAARVGLTDRGVIAPGSAADLVVLDPVRLTDTATFDTPAQFATGIELVIVNGEIVRRDGHDTGARPGRVLVPGGAENGSLPPGARTP